MFDEPDAGRAKPELAIKYLEVLLENEETFMSLLSDVQSRKILLEISVNLQAAAVSAFTKSTFVLQHRRFHF